MTTDSTIKLERNKKGRLKRLTKAQREALYLNQTPKDKYGESDTVKAHRNRAYAPKLSDE